MGGIVTDSGMRTSDPAIFAVGDAVAVEAMVDRLVHHSIILEMNGGSIREEEAKERLSGQKAKTTTTKTATTTTQPNPGT